ncbi:MAG: alanine--tRNA ligase [Amylibacter sp.]|nr:alanine--tRNA ligase [Amylibacter sp.]
MVGVNDIRSTFLSYFEKNGHEVVDSSPLVPRNDPTLMFVNSGMVQFKNLFTGIETRDYNRATSAQKCVRAGGKHNDLDNVGYTARHHTFFEMLGNFSFGDYFKEEAIPLAWNLITKNYGIDKSKLVTTVYHTDDEAYEIWKKLGISEDRIIRIDTSDNFWQMGPTGPCGPCTEIFYDHGEHIWGGPPGSPQEDGDRFIEIWNIVFMQNEQFTDGSMRALDMQSIDTGMGLERIAALLQGSHDNYDTDLFKALIEASAQITGVDPYCDQNVHHRIIADHLRSTSFLIADGVLPSNEGRGYVLRRIMRRAMRHAHLIGSKDPLMYRLVPELVRQMGQAYPELIRGQSVIEETLLLEETRFKTTLDRGLRLLDAELDGMQEGQALDGETAFKLYDTFGFPLDLTQDALREKGVEVDTDAFDAAMDAQKAKARAAWTGSGETADESVWFDIEDKNGPTEFLGYDTEAAEGQIIAVILKGRAVDSVDNGDEVQLVLNQTPFYAESGGQVSDKGCIKTASGSVTISDVKKKAGVFVHIGTVSFGTVKKGDAAELTIDPIRRGAIRANHSATHLLHEALRKILGVHVAQRGSLNAEDRLRFDFNHSKAVSSSELVRVEKDVNNYIRQNTQVETRIMTPDKARDLGAQALFGEKYGNEVRVVSMGREEGSAKGIGGSAYSLELCGGTHVDRTGDIGVFVALSDSASSSGVRRIEALTGQAAQNYLRNQGNILADAAFSLKVSSDEVPTRIKALQEERKLMQSEIAELRKQVAMNGTSVGLHDESINGVAFFGQILADVPGKDLRGLIDEHKKRLGSGVIVLISGAGGKATIAVGVTNDLTDSLSAVDLARIAAEMLGGKGGGGRPDMAQAGGQSVKNSEAALDAVRKNLEG